MSRADVIAARPLAWLALAAVAGVAVSDAAAAILPPWSWLVFAAAAGVAVRWSQHAAALPALVAACFGFRHALVVDATWNHPLRRVLEQRPAPLDVVAEGRIVKPLRRDLPGSEPGQALFIAERVHAPYLGRLWSGPAPVRLLPGREADPVPGHYRIEGRLALPPPTDNPGQFDAAAFALRHGLVAELRASRSDLVAPDRWNVPAVLGRGAERCRQWLAAALRTGLGEDSDALTIILAIVLGSTEADSRALEQPFRASGTLHIFSVSGLHVGIVGWILWRLLKPLGLPRGALALVVGLSLFGYAFLTGLQSSSVRAAVMAAVLLSGELWQRRSDMLNSLGAAALLILIDDSNQLFSIGFQLSFVVMAAIAVLNGPILALMRRWTEPDPFLPEILLGRWARLRLTLRRWVAGTLSVSAAAWIGGLPLMLHHFHLATPVALLANIVLVPVAFLILFTAVLAFAATLVHLPVAPVLLGNANWALARIALASAQAFAALPGGNFFLDPPSPSLRPTAELTALRLRAGGGAQHLRVGRSDWLLDTGGSRDYDFLLRPFLNHRAVNGLAGLILSHADFEHIGAAPQVVRDHAPRRILLSALETGARSGSLRNLRTLGIEPGLLAVGDRVELGSSPEPAAAEVLFPPRDLRVARANDRALVLRLDLGVFRVLWCGDAGFTAEKFVVDSLPSEAARCDVLLRNQHSQDYSLSPEFLDRARPRVIVSSNNKFPDLERIPPRIRDACAARGIRLLDQAETGAVTLRFWPRRLEIVPFRGNAPGFTLIPATAAPE